MIKALPSVIKWSGSKRSVAVELSKYIQKSETYYEPFVGGGALMPFAKSPKAIASDIIPELINLWNAIKNTPIDVANEYSKRWHRLQEDGPSVYYEIRDNFNKTKDYFDFLFLTRTCVNGLIRYNKNGAFNNSFHLSRPGINPETLKKILINWSSIIQHFVFINTDYRECLSTVKKGDFVFLDPPYGGTKDRYTRNEFNLNDFYIELDRLNRIGAKWMLTFDGTAGSRNYSFEPPYDTYQEKFFIETGNSSFRKLMDNQKDIIKESVYLNFKISDIL